MIERQLKLLEGGCILGLFTEDGKYVTRFKTSNELPDTIKCALYFMMGYKLDIIQAKYFSNGKYLKYLMDIGYLIV